jgi:ABC-type bacteriocin/lantibiotic exporter with double-glycine peptidase domain
MRQKRRPRSKFAWCAAFAITLGCYRGSARDVTAAALARDPAWIVVNVPEVRQRGASDCGAAALASVLAYWGRAAPLATIERAIDTGSGGASAAELERFARGSGLYAYVFYGDFSDLEHELRAGRPVIVGVVKPYSPGHGHSHYEVVTGYEPAKKRVLTFDPALGLRENDLGGFMAEWQPTERVALVAFEGEP